MMEKNTVRLPVTIMRGGTSKGVYILRSDLPQDQEQWDPLLLRLMGGPDKKQIDGLGGSQSVTSKVAIIQKSDRPDADVDYTFAQVSKEIKKENIDLLSRIMSMQKTHPSYAMTGAMCTAAAVVPGSIVQQVLSEGVDTQFIRIGHPAGILECGVDYREEVACPIIDDPFGFRTANLLLEGTAQIRLTK